MEFVIYNITTEPKSVMVDDNVIITLDPNTYEVVDTLSERIYQYWLSYSVTSATSAGLKIVTDTKEVRRLKCRKALATKSALANSVMLTDEIGNAVATNVGILSEPINTVSDINTIKVVAVTPLQEPKEDTPDCVECSVVETVTELPDTTITPEEESASTDETFISNDIPTTSYKYDMNTLQTLTSSELKQLCKDESISLATMNKTNMIEALSKVEE